MSSELTDVLRREHAVILDVLDNLESLTRRLRAGGDLPSGDVANIMRFLSGYLDQFHHDKEESLLFPALLEAGMSERVGPIPVMLHEHDLGRRLVGTLSDVAANGLIDRESFIAAATGFVELMRAHIRKEDNALFVMAEQVLSDERKQALLQAFSERGDYQGWTA